MKITQIDDKIRDLTRMRDALGSLRRACDSNSPTATECPFLDSLEEIDDKAESKQDGVSTHLDSVKR